MKGGSDAKEGETAGSILRKRDGSSKEKKEGDSRERSRESGRERDGEQTKERSKEREKLVESLQLSSVAKQTSRSQSPGLTELRAESVPILQLAQEPASSTSSKHSSERSHHSKSHSRDLTSSLQAAMLSPQPTANTSAVLSPSATQQQKPPSRSMEDSPQKQLLSTTNPGGILSSPSGYHSANVSYAMSSDEFASPQSTYRANGFMRRADLRPEFFHHHHVLLKTLSQPFYHSSPYNIGGRDVEDGSPLSMSEHSYGSYEVNGSISEDPEYMRSYHIYHLGRTGTPAAEHSFHHPIPASTSSPYTVGGELPQHNYYAFQANQTNDEGDGAGSSGSSRAATAIAHLNNKVARTKELIRLEQTIRDDNVNEYLKLAANADKQQILRIKAVFEKKNQKSAHSIAQLQKKMDGYHKRIKNWETHGSSTGQGSHRQPREMLRDMGQGLKNVGGNIRDGITGLGGTVMSKPREFAHLIKNKFGSADNINQMSARNNWIEGRRPEGEGPHTLPGALRSDSSGGGTPGGTQQPPVAGSNSNNATTGGAGSGSHHNKLTSEEDSECSSVTSSGGYQGQGGNNLNDGVYSLKQIFCELKERRDDIERICDKLDSIKTLSQEVSYLSSALQEERFRSERMEEQINDLTELHQNEVENLKQALADVEEKVQYQSEERVRDIHEMLDLCQTKISKMEHQAMQQQQYVNLEGIEGFNARVLAVKLINVVLTVLQVVLLLVATAAGILMPFLRTRDDLKAKTFYNGMGMHSQSFVFHIVRILTTTMVVVGAVFILRQWPELWEISSHLVEKLRKAIVHNKGVEFTDGSSEAGTSTFDNR